MVGGPCTIGPPAIALFGVGSRQCSLPSSKEAVEASSPIHHLPVAAELERVEAGKGRYSW